MPAGPTSSSEGCSVSSFGNSERYGAAERRGPILAFPIDSARSRRQPRHLVERRTAGRRTGTPWCLAATPGTRSSRGPRPAARSGRWPARGALLATPASRVRARPGACGFSRRVPLGPAIPASTRPLHAPNYREQPPDELNLRGAVTGSCYRRRATPRSNAGFGEPRAVSRLRVQPITDRNTPCRRAPAAQADQADLLRHVR